MIDAWVRVSLVGIDLVTVEARIVVEDDFDVPTGEAGELILRDNNPWGAGEGYYKMPEESAQTLAGGWFHSGDIGHIDAKGYLHITDRPVPPSLLNADVPASLEAIVLRALAKDPGDRPPTPVHPVLRR